MPIRPFPLQSFVGFDVKNPLYPRSPGTGISDYSSSITVSGGPWRENFMDAKPPMFKM